MKKLILDLDVGVDDAQALMVALSDPDVQILGITCCFGNTPLENVLKNTLRVLKVCNRLDVSFDGRNFVEISKYVASTHLLHRFQCTKAVQCLYWLLNATLGIIMAKTGLEMSRIQTRQDWSWCRRKKLWQPWSRWSSRTPERWTMDFCFYVKINWWQIGTKDAHWWSFVFRWLWWPRVPSPIWPSQYSWILPCIRSWKPFTSWEETLIVCFPSMLIDLLETLHTKHRSWWLWFSRSEG